MPSTCKTIPATTLFFVFFSQLNYQEFKLIRKRRNFAIIIPKTFKPPNNQVIDVQLKIKILYKQYL